MAAPVSKVWEVGSEFHWSDAYLTPADADPNITLPSGVLFSRARGALAVVMRMRAASGAPACIHLPSYFCMDIAQYLAGLGEVRWYRHLPGQGVDFSTLDPARGDMVLALNMFGAETGADWQGWGGRDRVCLIEDHSHDPLSPWATARHGDYAIASLRKTLPIPDGALLWSPRDHPLPATGTGKPQGADAKLAAMLLKAGYLNGAAIAKDAFRVLQLAGEAQLDADDGAPAHDVTRAVLGALDLAGLREQRARNHQLFTAALTDAPIAGVEPVFATIPQGCVPYNPILRFSSRAERDRVRRRLAERAIFAPCHWQQDEPGFTSGDPDAMRLAARLLTIPLDFRCTPDDVARVVALLRAVVAGEPA